MYGTQELYDPISEYAIPESVSKKMIFTGYIPRNIPAKEGVHKIRKEHGVANGEKLVVVTTGGGGDGFHVMDAYLSMLEAHPERATFKSILITGPFMPLHYRKSIFDRAKKIGVRAYHFFRQMEKMLSAADLVVSMGGYNTLCEILSQKTVSLIIPREDPRKEQLIRAQALSRKHLVDFLPWRSTAPDAFFEKVTALLAHPEPYSDAISRFPLTGIDVMRQRLSRFRCRK